MMLQLFAIFLQWRNIPKLYSGTMSSRQMALKLSLCMRLFFTPLFFPFLNLSAFGFYSDLSSVFHFNFIILYYGFSSLILFFLRTTQATFKSNFQTSIF